MSPIVRRRPVSLALLTSALSCTVLLAPVQAARPLLDQHQWDRAFALFARDANVPWRPTAVRLQTYSSAPVEFRAYAAETEDVIVANRPQGRVLDTRRRRPLASWTFKPPSGYRVEGNTVILPLNQREGIFVIEARRGSAIQQVWVNRTRVGLVSKEAPQGLLVYGTDLGTGRPLAHMRLLFLLNGRLVTRMTDVHGLVRWNAIQRPRFVLAEWGNSRAFLSFLPQAPMPASLAAVRVDRAVVRSGENIHVVGFARHRQAHHFTAMHGNAHITLVLHGRIVAAAQVPLDEAGAFSTRLHVPGGGVHGQASVIATVGNAGAGVGVEVNAAEDLVLSIAPQCATQCVAKHPVPLFITANRNGQAAGNVPINVRVVRYPHIFPPGTNEADLDSWGATTVLDQHLMTNSNGHLRVSVPGAADGLPSTLGIEVSTAGHSASASTRVQLPNSAVALEITPEHHRVDVGDSIGIGLRGFTAEEGRPVTGIVRVTMSHGMDHYAQYVKLDGQGRGRALFHQAQFGDNLLTAVLTSQRGSAIDANSVRVEPQGLAGDIPQGVQVTVKTNRQRYRPGEKIVVDAQARGAQGAVFVSLDDSRLEHYHVAGVHRGYTHQGVQIGDSQGRVQAAVAFVKNGALVTGNTAVAVDGPGHERLMDLSLNAGSYRGGEIAKVFVHDGENHRFATTIVRLSDSMPSGSADFQSMGDQLTIGGVTTQVSSGDDPPWHAWVSPQNSRVIDLFADLGRRPVPKEAPALSDAASHISYWQVERASSMVEIPVPQSTGRYILSIMRIYDDGAVGSATTLVNVV